MMRQRAHGRNGRALLPPALRPRRHEHARILAPVAARAPLLAGLVPEGFPLRGEVAVAGGDAEEEGVVAFELVRGDCGDGGGFGGRVHFGQDFFGEGFGDSFFFFFF